MNLNVILKLFRIIKFLIIIKIIIMINYYKIK